MLLFALVMLFSNGTNPYIQSEKPLEGQYVDFKALVVLDPFLSQKNFITARKMALDLKSRGLLEGFVVVGRENVRIFPDPAEAKFQSLASHRFRESSENSEAEAGFNYAANNSSDEYAVGRYFLQSLLQLLARARHDGLTTLWVTQGWPESRNSLGQASQELIAHGEIGTVSAQNVTLATRVCNEFSESFKTYNLLHMLDLSRDQRGSVLAGMLVNAHAYLRESDVGVFPFYRWYRR